MKFSLFRSGPVPRLILAALYAGFAFGSVALVERAAARRAAAPASSPSPAHARTRATAAENLAPLRIEIETVNPVASWTVRLDGVVVSDAEKSPTTWEASVPAASSAAALLDIEAPRANEAHATAPTTLPPTGNALRVRLARGTARLERTFWCGAGRGDCVFEIRLEELAETTPTR